MAKKEKIIVFWFRRDLRLEDNAGLYYALQEGLPVLPVFIFDRDILEDLSDKRDARVQFLLNRVGEIHKDLSVLGSSLLVSMGRPADVFRKLSREFSIDSVYTNRDYEPYAIQRDAEVGSLLNSAGIAFLSFKDHVIFEKLEVATDKGEPYKVFTPYKKRWLEKWSAAEIQCFDSESCAERFHRCNPHSIPSLEDLGFLPSDIPVPPCRIDAELISHYHERRNFPGVNGTSRLGIHLRHGTMSIRHAAVQGASLSETWLNELIWRDFYSMVLYNFPHVVNNAFKSNYDRIPWNRDQNLFGRWCSGLTGYPIVDAGMRELNQTGYMHNRVRMIVASFLTKHLLIDWRWGEAYFASKLLDYELASNNGGWQWAAGTGTDAQPYFRVFNPETQAEKFDPAQAYIRTWVPELHTPDYPDPIVDHKTARKRAIDTFKAALS